MFGLLASSYEPEPAVESGSRTRYGGLIVSSRPRLGPMFEGFAVPDLMSTRSEFQIRIERKVVEK